MVSEPKKYLPCVVPNIAPCWLIVNQESILVPNMESLNLAPCHLQAASPWCLRHLTGAGARRRHIHPKWIKHSAATSKRPKESEDPKAFRIISAAYIKFMQIYDKIVPTIG